MTAPAKAIRNLVFEGGGVRGIAYAGALSVFEEEGYLQDLRCVAGSSAGAFTALLLSLDYSPHDIREALKSIHFETLEDSPNPIRIVTKYGLYKGQVLYDWIAAQVLKCGFDEDLTFDQLRQQCGRDLRVFATDLNIQNTREFSAESTPEASVVGAVRASMSIPLMYSAWQFPNNIPDNHFYVDGGTVFNYPITVFDTMGGPNEETLGFCFENRSGLGAYQDLDNIFEFTKSLFATMLSTQKIDFSRDQDELRRSVKIDDLGFKATDLDLPEEAFERLFISGREAASLYLTGQTKLLSG